MAVDEDAPRIDVVEPGEEVDDRRLSRAGRTDEGDRLARPRVEVDAPEHGGTGLVAEGHVAELHVARDICKLDGARGVGEIRGLVHHLEHPLRAGDRRHDHVVLVGDLVDRPAELLGVVEEARDDADGETSGYRESPARGGHDRVAQVVDQVHEWGNDAGIDLGLGSRLAEPDVHRVELGHRAVLAPEGLDDPLAGDGFLDQAVQGPELPLLVGEGRPRPGGDLRGYPDADRYDDQRKHRQERTQDQHHADGTQHHDEAREELGRAHREGRVDVLDVVREAAHQLAVGLRVEVAERQGLELREEVGPDVAHGPLGQPRHDVDLEPGEHRAQEVGADQFADDEGEPREIDLAGTGDHDVDGPSDQKRTDQGEDGAREHEKEDDGEPDLPPFQVSPEPEEGRLRVFRFFLRAHVGAVPAPSRSAHARPHRGGRPAFSRVAAGCRFGIFSFSH